MKKPTDPHSKEVADPSMQRYTYYICLKAKGVIWYYAGRSDTFSYWCLTKDRAIKYLLPYHVNIELRSLSGIPGHKRCFAQTAIEYLKKPSPQLYHKKIKDYF